jgi:hypothetical protein
VRKVKENMPFGKYANAAWAEWAERGAGSLRGIAGWRGRGWAGPDGPKSEENSFSNKKLNLRVYQDFGNLHKEI